MVLTSDTFIERNLLKRKVMFWRVIGVVAIIAASLIIIEKNSDVASVAGKDYIARISIHNMVLDDSNLYDLLDSVKEDKHAKAVIVELDTPGGVAVAGETIHRRLQEIRKVKPVVASMRAVCASAGYMIAIGSDRIFAMNSTITGSIGVILQAAEFSELAKKIGITPITVKSSELKGNPSIAEPITPEGQKVLQDMIDEFYLSFVEMVAESRNLPLDDVKKIADGRVYSAKKALKLGLIDAIGEEQDAVAWLVKEKNIDASLKVKQAKVKKSFDGSFEEMFSISGWFPQFSHQTPFASGLMLIWRLDN
jgi:protease-4